MSVSGEQAVSVHDPTLEANKRVVLAFYDAAINRTDFAAASAFIGDRYVQHNPRIADGLDGFT